MATIEAIPAYEEMLYTIFQQNQPHGEGQVVALTSANPGEGVTYIADTLATQLGRYPLNTIACVDSRRLSELESAPEEIVDMCEPTRQKNVFKLGRPSLKPRGAELTTMWHGSSNHRQEWVAQLRRRFDYVLLDCPSLRASGDVLSLAPLVDGVILVVEANRTKKEHIENAVRSIEGARGRVLGHVLNKRIYVVPEWLYGRL
jgi:Mrp family chromosome partitioning ATPase